MVDATRLQLFDPEDGRNLMVDADGPAAVGPDARGSQDATGDSEQVEEQPASATRDGFLTIVSSS